MRAAEQRKKGPPVLERSAWEAGRRRWRTRRSRASFMLVARDARLFTTRRRKSAKVTVKAMPRTFRMMSSA